MPRNQERSHPAITEVFEASSIPRLENRARMAARRAWSYKKDELADDEILLCMPGTNDPYEARNTRPKTGPNPKPWYRAEITLRKRQRPRSVRSQPEEGSVTRLPQGF